MLKLHRNNTSEKQENENTCVICAGALRLYNFNHIKMTTSYIKQQDALTV